VGWTFCLERKIEAVGGVGNPCLLSLLNAALYQISLAFPSTSLPSFPNEELKLAYKWDVAMEDFVFKAAVGAGTCALASLVLFRGGSSRLAFTAFGLGWGSGDAYRVATTGSCLSSSHV